MRFPLLISVLLLICFSIQAQNTTPRWLIGTEVQLYFEDLDYQRGTLGNYGYGVHIEKPIGRISIATGLQQQQFGWHWKREFTGEFVPGEDDQADTYGYLFENHKIAVWNVPVRLQFRLPCNCVYVQAAVVNSFLRAGPNFVRDSYINYLTQAPAEDFVVFQPVPKFSVGYELGMGLNFHLSDNWKLYSRLVYAQYAFNQKDLAQFKTLGQSYLGLNLGLQYALY